MLRRVVVIVLVIAVILVAQRQLRGPIRSWVANTFYMRTAAMPAGDTPDHLLLSWNGDPRTRQAINWRTAPSVTGGVVEYRRADGAEVSRVEAAHVPIEDKLLENDPVVHRFHALLDGLAPGTEYAYRAGTDQGAWSEWSAFTTAPAAPEPFSFVYLGDAQIGLEYFGELVQTSWERHPESAFYLVAGDLVNDGRWRNQWDEFFAGGAGVFDRVPLMPCLGNHDVDDDGEAVMYLASFALPENGPPALEKQRAYHFDYGNALFVVLDTEMAVTEQTAWLDEVLGASEATWKFVMYHRPVYSSARARDNPTIRREWAPVFERHGVDIAFQGHDHAYMRTAPVKADARAEDGTVYVLSVAGTKYYDARQEYPFVEKVFQDISTYQVIDIETAPDRLTYRAYNAAGEVMDEFRVEK